MTQDDDYLMLEDLLVERIQSEMPDIKLVMTAMDLASVQGARQIEPAVHVVYLGDEIGDDNSSQGGNGAAQVVTQQWMVVLVVKFAGTVASGKGNRKKAGPLITKLLRTLSGWQPKGAFRPLRRIRAPKVGYDNGFAYYPYAFKTTLVLKGST